jgi:hypothetical protein
MKQYSLDFLHYPSGLCYMYIMFRITRQAQGRHGSFVKLAQFDSDDYAVIVRSPFDMRLHQRYIGPDLAKAEEIFTAEVTKVADLATER